MAELNFKITEEQVREAVKAVVREEMERMSEYGVWNMLKDEMKRQITEAMKKEVGGKFDEIAKQAVEEHVSEPFTLDDGWGYERRTFDTYADFVKFKLHEKFSKNNWVVKREFEKRVQEKVDKVWEEYRDDAIAEAMAKVEAMKAVE